MPKLANQNKINYWINLKLFHFGLAPSPVGCLPEPISNQAVKEQLAIARAMNIVNEHNIKTLNNAIIELRKDIKKLKSKI